MGASIEDRQKQLTAIAAIPGAGTKAQVLRRAGFAESTIRHATPRTWERLMQNPDARAVAQDSTIDLDHLAEKLSALLDAETIRGGYCSAR